MSKNPRAEPIWIANVAIPGGGRDLYLDRDQAQIYNADPDAFAARHFGLTKIQYLQWVDLDGAPLCGHRTATGDLCRNMIGGNQLDASEWKARHRKFYCVSHGGKSKRK